MKQVSTMTDREADVEAVARGIYDVEPFYMPIGQIQDGIETARKFSFDDAPAYRQNRAKEFARSALSALEARGRGKVESAVPVKDWRIVVEELVLIYVVHDNAQYEKDAATRLAEWEGWHVGRWIDFNSGGWTWHGLAGLVTHVAPLPSPPTEGK